jgi:spore coat protein JB
MKEKRELMRTLSAIAFYLVDLNLYLDTHPNDVNAMMLFNQYREKYLTLVAEYERKYGPLMAINGVKDNKWKWINDPWPWEFSANMEV